MGFFDNERSHFHLHRYTSKDSLCIVRYDDMGDCEMGDRLYVPGRHYFGIQHRLLGRRLLDY